MLGDLVKTHAASIALHGLVGVLILGIPVAQRVISRPAALELEIVEVAPPAAEPAPEPRPAPPSVVPPVPSAPRPAAVPEPVRQRTVASARPFQERAASAGTREAPPDVEAVPAPVAPLPELAMETTIDSGGGDYVTTSARSGAMPLRAGAGGGRGGTGSGAGAPGPVTANQGGRDVKVSPDWEISRMPEPLNDRDFEPDYPPQARREGREAVVLLRLSIDAAGAVSKVQVVDAPRGYGFERAAAEYARRLRFSPAQAGANKVASRIEWSVHFYVRH